MPSYPVIWLIRHSIRDDSLTTEKLSVTDLSITDQGAKLAKKLAIKLREFVHPPEFIDPSERHRIYVSPYRRTIETGLLIAAEYPKSQIIIEEKLSEATMPFPIVKKTGLNLSSPPFLLPFLQSREIVSPETREEVTTRALKFIGEIQSLTGQDIFVVTHGSIIMLILCSIFDWYKKTTNDGDIDVKNVYFPKYCNYVGVRYDGHKWNLMTSDFLSEPNNKL